MKPAVVEDVHNTTYRTLTRAVLTNFSLHNKSIPFAVAFDATVLHFKPWSSIVFDPSNTSEWKNVLTKYYASDEYKQLNEITAGDALMAKYATIRWLNALSTPREGQYHPDNEKNFEMHLESVIGDFVVGRLIQEAKEIVKELQVAEGFTHAGIPYSRLLNEPEKFRRMARDKIIVEFLALLKDSKKQQPSTKRATSPTNLGGLPLGVKRIERWRELSSVLPAELVIEDILDYKIASRTLRVTERKGGFPDYVVYLDKSGSMKESILYKDGRSVRYVPKISFAAAATLALQRRLNKLKAKLTLKPFDVEVHDAITDNLEIVDFLMRIRADNGTNVTKALEDAYENHRDEKVVIISDGIDQVSEVTARKCRKAGIEVKVVFIKTDNVVLRRYFDCILLREAKPNVLLTILTKR